VPSSLLALLDDIASVLDDVAVLTKISAKKTAGVLGDDLALNAQQVAGVLPDRELPVVWAVARGSALNKAILIPAALVLSAVAPWAVVPLLMFGGAFLCYEGFEKLAHRFLHSKTADHERRAKLAAAASRSAEELIAFERDKIQGAIRTDFILSAEIVAITLGSVAAAPMATRVGVLVAISAIMTVGVYGLVAGIVKLDDAGLALTRRGGGRAVLGRGILRAAPHLMSALSIVGTAAMFLVGGGILTHGIPPLHHWIQAVARRSGDAFEWIVPTLFDGAAGVAVGAVAVLLVTAAKGLWPKRASAA
jgi:uncharacterized protein